MVALCQRDDRDGHRRQILRFAGALPNFQSNGEDAAADSSRRGDTGDGHELGRHGVNHGREQFDDSDSGKREHTRAVGSVTAERDGSSVEAMGPVRLVGRRVARVAGDDAGLLPQLPCAASEGCQRCCAGLPPTLVVCHDRPVEPYASGECQLRREAPGSRGSSGQLLAARSARACVHQRVGCCYVQVREGCAVCGSSGNFSEADWQRKVAEQPLGEVEQA
ncbi:hypothetical protein PF008_g21252 [Phytophthora fragariae]|uniref:Uncharacterized protein n=1 Tax=Phytophthora fragariae TaxID=53985 RepID=A0A6G0QXB3_9STRA|nr:hypothetical protein PF008_g21252 [Phytophthora fragariae]